MKYIFRILCLSALLILSIMQMTAQKRQLIKYNLDSIRNDTGNFASSIIIDNDNNKWFYTKNGVFRIKNQEFNFFKVPNALYSNMSKLTIKNIAIEKNSKIWLYYSWVDVSKRSGNKLIKYDSSHYSTIGTVETIFPMNRINDMKTDKGDTLWIATNNGLAKYKDSVWTVYTTQTSTIPTDTIYNIEIGSDGIMWMSTLKGMYNYYGGEWTSFSDIKPPIYKADNLGNIWFSAEATGYVSLRKFIPGNWTNYWTFSWGAGAQYKITSIEMDTTHNLWFSVWDNFYVKAGSLLKMRYNSSKDWVIDNEGIPGFPPNTKVYSMKCEENNDLWIGADNNLWVYNSEGLHQSIADNNNTENKNNLSVSAFPNPLSNSTRIAYQNPDKGRVIIKVFDSRGKEIKLLLNEIQEKGSHELMFSNDDLSAGLYFVNVTAGNISESRKLIKQ